MIDLEKIFILLGVSNEKNGYLQRGAAAPGPARTMGRPKYWRSWQRPGVQAKELYFEIKRRLFLLSMYLGAPCRRPLPAGEGTPGTLNNKKRGVSHG